MLTADDMHEIRRLARSGLSIRAIASKTHHGRNTIAKLVSQSKIKRPISTKLAPANRGAIFSIHHTYRRCKRCGTLVKLPCLACEIARLRLEKLATKAA